MKKIFLSIQIIFFASFSNNIFANCGTSSCPLFIYSPLTQGFFSIGLSHEYIYQNQIFVGSSRSFIGAIPRHHDEVSTLNQVTTFSIGYGIFDFGSLNFSIPFIHREHSHIHNHHGEELWEYWNFSAIGDMTLLTNVAVLKNINDNSSYVLNLNAGIKIPTGVTDIVNQEGEEAEVTLQPGNGSTDFIFGASFYKNLTSIPALSGSAYSEFPISIGVSYKLNNKGTYDYKLGNEFLLHLSTAYRFLEKASLLLQINARFQDHADVGTTGESREDTGGKWIFVSPGLKFYLSEDISLNSYVQIPIYRNVNGIQQAAAYNLQFGIQKEIDLLN